MRYDIEKAADGCFYVMRMHTYKPMRVCARARVFIFYM